MTNNTITLTDRDKLTLRTAAYGAVSLLAAAGPKAHRVATDGCVALTSATGVVGHVLSQRRGAVPLGGKSVAALADRVLPALTESMRLLAAQDPAEAENFRSTIVIAVDAARIHQDRPGPAATEMARKITAALDAA
ncbi:hypothetical protein [Nocardia sp. BMG111209]|uniref:hypothetical protein n=1 Tax=Nocardia sp. BMG111209 TaxID=1160137 RepID=UPI00037EE25E|nr:hypothetical protein [Nocardia sp. BMG111209]